MKGFDLDSTSNLISWFQNVFAQISQALKMYYMKGLILIQHQVRFQNVFTQMSQA